MDVCGCVSVCVWMCECECVCVCVCVCVIEKYSVQGQQMLIFRDVSLEKAFASFFTLSKKEHFLSNSGKEDFLIEFTRKKMLDRNLLKSN